MSPAEHGPPPQTSLVLRVGGVLCSTAELPTTYEFQTYRASHNCREVMRPADAAVSHWEIPPATTTSRMGDCKKEGEKQQNMAAGGSHLADVGEETAERAHFYYPQPCSSEAQRQHHQCFCTSSFPHCNHWPAVGHGS